MPVSQKSRAIRSVSPPIADRPVTGTAVSIPDDVFGRVDNACRCCCLQLEVEFVLRVKIPKSAAWLLTNSDWADNHVYSMVLRRFYDFEAVTVRENSEELPRQSLLLLVFGHASCGVLFWTRGLLRSVDGECGGEENSRQRGLK